MKLYNIFVKSHYFSINITDFSIKDLTISDKTTIIYNA